MKQSEQATAFAADLDALVKRYADEFDLTIASAVGVLTIKAIELTMNALEEKEDE